MSTSTDTQVKNLATAIKALQRMSTEQYETLNNEFSNRAESQYNLMQHLFKRYQVMKEVIQAMAGELKVPEAQMKGLWDRASKKMAEVSIQEELLSDYQKELEKENGRS